MEINKHTAIFVDSIFTTQDFTLLKNDTNMISVFFYILWRIASKESKDPPLTLIILGGGGGGFLKKEMKMYSVRFNVYVFFPNVYIYNDIKNIKWPLIF